MQTNLTHQSLFNSKSANGTRMLVSPFPDQFYAEVQHAPILERHYLLDRRQIPVIRRGDAAPDPRHQLRSQEAIKMPPGTYDARPYPGFVYEQVSDGQPRTQYLPSRYRRARLAQRYIDGVLLDQSTANKQLAQAEQELAEQRELELRAYEKRLLEEQKEAKRFYEEQVIPIAGALEDIDLNEEQMTEATEDPEQMTWSPTGIEAEAQIRRNLLAAGHRETFASLPSMLASINGNDLTHLTSTGRSSTGSLVADHMLEDDAYAAINPSIHNPLLRRRPIYSATVSAPEDVIALDRASTNPGQMMIRGDVIDEAIPMDTEYIVPRALVPLLAAMAHDEKVEVRSELEGLLELPGATDIIAKLPTILPTDRVQFLNTNVTFTDPIYLPLEQWTALVNSARRGVPPQQAVLPLDEQYREPVQRVLERIDGDLSQLPIFVFPSVPKSAIAVPEEVAERLQLAFAAEAYDELSSDIVQELMVTTEPLVGAKIKRLLESVESAVQALNRYGPESYDARVIRANAFRDLLKIDQLEPGEDLGHEGQQEVSFSHSRVHHPAANPTHGRPVDLDRQLRAALASRRERIEPEDEQEFFGGRGTKRGGI